MVQRKDNGTLMFMTQVNLLGDARYLVSLRLEDWETC